MVPAAMPHWGSRMGARSCTIHRHAADGTELQAGTPEGGGDDPLV